jgi:hypothetical protein
MIPSESGGIATSLGAARAGGFCSGACDVPEIEAQSPFRLPGPAPTPGNLVHIARTIEKGFDGLSSSA